MALPFVGLATVFSYQSTISPSAYTTIGGYESGSFSGDKVSTAKITNSQTTNGVDLFIAGTQDPGSFDAKCFYLPGDASQTALEAIRLSGAAVNFKISYLSGANSITFSGIIESMTKAFPLDKPVTLDIKIKLSGIVTIV